MRKISFNTTVVIILAIGILAVGVMEGQTQPPPVAAPLVREGDFAVKLAEALKVGNPSSEAEAESMLGAAGVAPKNGWIADYPVTPDIIGELRDSIWYAAQAKTIPLDGDAALKVLADVQASVGMTLSPGSSGPSEEASEGARTSERGYPDQTIINNYYSEEGPPIVTYYAPPPDYYYLYAWVPYPFWWSGFWFGGFFVLNDFHRHFRDHGRFFVVTNHFRDVRSHRVFRIDPGHRFRGRTFAGIGAPRASNFMSTGVQRAPERIFNSRPGSSFSAPSVRTVRPQSDTSRTLRQPTGNLRTVNPFDAGRVYSQPPGAGKQFMPPSGTAVGGITTGR